MAFTVFDAEKKARKLIKEGRFDQAVTFLEAAIEKHSKNWIFKDVTRLKHILEEAKGKKVQDCISRAKALLGEEGDLPPENSLKEARFLIEEAERTGSSSEARLVREGVDKKLTIHFKYNEAEVAIKERKLEDAFTILQGIRDVDPEAPKRIDLILDTRARCSSVMTRADEARKAERFQEAMDLIAEVEGLNLQWPALRVFKENVEKERKAIGLYNETSKALSAGDLDSALAKVAEALQYNPHLECARELEKQVKLAKAQSLYNQGLNEKQTGNLLEALEAFEWIERLGIDYLDSAQILKELKEAKAKIEGLYNRSKQSRGDGDLEEAKRALEESLGLGYDFGPSERLLEQVRDAVGQAEGDFKKAKEHFLHKEDIVRAREHIQEALSLCPKNREYQALKKDITGAIYKVKAFYDTGIKHEGEGMLEEALSSYRDAEAFGYRFGDLEKRRLLVEQRIEKAKRLLEEGSRMFDAGNLKGAVGSLQEALMVYPRLEEAARLYERASQAQRIKDCLDRAEGYCNRLLFRECLEELKTAKEMGEADPMLQERMVDIESRAMKALSNRIGDLAEERKVITALKDIDAIEPLLALTGPLLEQKKELERIQEKARKLYQEGYSLWKKRKYDEARGKLQKAIEENAELYLAQEALEQLNEEEEGWRVYLKAKEHFRKGEYQATVDLLKGVVSQYQGIEEIGSLLKEAQSRIGFSGRFRTNVEGRSYSIIPDDVVLVGRNTRTHLENDITLRLPDISRRHGKIIREKGQYFYEHFEQCYHGTRLNGRAVDRKVELKDGDILGFGFFKEDDGTLVDGEEVAQLKVSIFKGAKAGDVPTLSLSILKGSSPEFKEDVDRIYILAGTHMSIGRARDNPIRVQDNSIENHHALITQEGGLYYIRDLGTPSGLFINSEPLMKRRMLRLGDRVKPGRVEFTIERLSRKESS